MTGVGLIEVSSPLMGVSRRERSSSIALGESPTSFLLFELDSPREGKSQLGKKGVFLLMRELSPEGRLGAFQFSSTGHLSLTSKSVSNMETLLWEGRESRLSI